MANNQDDTHTCMQVNVSVQTDLSGADIDCLQQEFDRLVTENIKLKNLNDEYKVKEDAFKNDNEKVKLFTGLPSFAVLMMLINYIAPFLNESTATALDKFQQAVIIDCFEVLLNGHQIY